MPSSFSSGSVTSLLNLARNLSLNGFIAASLQSREEGDWFQIEPALAISGTVITKSVSVGSSFSGGGTAANEPNPSESASASRTARRFIGDWFGLGKSWGVSGKSERCPAKLVCIGDS